MKKKLFLKFFVLAVIGAFVTFTSCKDYDDDIKDLQGQITTLKELSTKIEGLTADVAAAKADAAKAKADAEKAIKDANDLLGKVDAAGKAAAEAKLEAAEAKKAAAEAKEEALKALETELEKAKEELKAATDAELEKMNKLVAELTEKVEAQLGTIGVAITEVYFIENGEEPQVNFSTVVQKANVFGKGLEGEMTFTKDAQVQVADHFFIKVSPANAVVTPEMIVLQNGLGEIFEDVTVTKVEAHTNLYTRATAPTGMWKVSVELDNYDAKAFEAATKKGNDHILFAVSINNTQAEFEDRQVISDYELSLDWKEYTADNKLGFTVDKKNVDEIRNRYGFTWGDLTAAKEYVWKDGAGAAVKPITSGTGINVKPGDDRSTKANYPAVQGKEIAIELTGDVKAFYVVLDSENAIESAPSELNAWKSYSYTGLNTVVVGNKTTITIDSKTAIKDEIGFRVFAVNHDGTLVDPDGKAFYVLLDTKATDWNAINTVITPQNKDDKKSNEVAASLTKLTGATTATWTTVIDGKEETNTLFNATFVAGASTYTTGGDVKGFAFDKVTKVYTTAINALTTYEDDKTYVGKLTVKNATGHVLATINVTMTKKLPTTVPAGFSVKTNQVVNGIYNAYLIPGNDTDVPFWTAELATRGTMPMKDVFNYGTGAADNYLITFATSMKAGDKDVDNAVAGHDVLSVAKSYIDNTTKHATTVEYNYGLISSKVDKDGYAIPHKVQATAFETVYNNIYNSTYTWAWDTKLPVANRQKTDVVYGDNTFTVDLNKVAGKSARDEKYSAPLGTPYLGSLAIKKAELISKANNVSGEYFTVQVGADNKTLTFSEASGSTNPTADVPSTLRITLKNMYNQDVVVNLDMVVKKR